MTSVSGVLERTVVEREIGARRGLPERSLPTPRWRVA